MKRLVPIILVVVVAIMVPSIAFGQKIQLRVTNYAQVEKAFKAINDAYMKLHPNIEIVYEPTPYDSYQQKFGAYIATKSGADVMGNELNYLWDAADSFIPLNDKLKSEPEVFKNLTSYNMLYRYMDPKGPLLGLPMSFNGNVMYFNKDILREAGLDPENPPQTWDQFAKACEAVKKIGKVPIAQSGGFVPLFWNWTEVQKNFFTSDAEILDLGRGKIPWTDPRMQKGLKLLTQMADNGWFQDGWSTFQGIPDSLDLFSSGGAAFIGSIISDVANWKQYEAALGQDKVGVMLWPAVDPKNPMMKKFSGFTGFPHCITKWTKHPKEAWDYLKFTVSATGSNLFLQIAGGQPNAKTFDKSIAGPSPNFAKIQKLIQNNNVQFVLLLSTREQNALQKGWEQYGGGGYTIEQWTKDLQDALDQSRDKKLQ